MNVLLFVLATHGLAALLIEGKPTAPIRWLLRKIVPQGDKMVSCYLCMGFWSASACFAIHYFGIDIPLWIFAGAGVSKFLNELVGGGFELQ